MLSDAIWKVKYQDSILNKILSCGYNDAWFVTLRSKVTTALEETNDESISNHNMGANQTWWTECICIIIEGYGITLQGHLVLHYGVIEFIHVNEMTLTSHCRVFMNVILHCWLCLAYSHERLPHNPKLCPSEYRAVTERLGALLSWCFDKHSSQSAMMNWNINACKLKAYQLWLY